MGDIGSNPPPIQRDDQHIPDSFEKKKPSKNAFQAYGKQKVEQPPAASKEYVIRKTAAGVPRLVEEKLTKTQKFIKLMGVGGAAIDNIAKFAADNLLSVPKKLKEKIIDYNKSRGALKAIDAAIIARIMNLPDSTPNLDTELEFKRLKAKRKVDGIIISDLSQTLQNAV